MIHFGIIGVFGTRVDKKINIHKDNQSSEFFSNVTGVKNAQS